MGVFAYIQSLVLLIASASSLYLGAVIIRTDRTPKYRWFFVMAVAAAVWAITNVLFAVLSGFAQIMLALLSYGAGVVLAIGFLEFCFASVSKHMNRYIERFFVRVHLCKDRSLQLPLFQNPKQHFYKK